MKYFLDANFISYFIGGKKEALNFINDVSSIDEIKIPDIAYYEILRGLFYKDAKNVLEKFEAFAKYFGVISMTAETMKIAAKIYADLRHRGKIIEDDDILIAALTIECGATLLTSNKRHFENIENLKILNLF
ncbi:MAG: PIN domain-containing protein [Bacteroides sp.]|nr:PIN domain-containing protein [Prevotella sp.]MCM1408651.1 PIN domain-containing protein [Treponema brennaborense]MCM1470512.1 PIN domain-containing protein [Bacteroides sp.]